MNDASNHDKFPLYGAFDAQMVFQAPLGGFAQIEWSQ